MDPDTRRLYAEAIYDLECPRPIQTSLGARIFEKVCSQLTAKERVRLLDYDIKRIASSWLCRALLEGKPL